MDITVRGARVTEIVMSGGERISIDTVVNAAGPAGHDIARLVGRDLPC
jgi:glycine/D-amino acid oxidase-like deaminating enzyme